MSRTIVFITGTDTGVGKTVLTCQLAKWLLARKCDVVALKPLCSGGRGDAKAIRSSTANRLPLDVVNPWYFSAPLSPALAARDGGTRVMLKAVLAHIRGVSRQHEIVLVEGAGGLLSPLGVDFDSRDLIAALGARIIIVAPNRLGVINQVRLTLEALPGEFRSEARVALMSPKKEALVSRTNPSLLKDYIATSRLQLLPWLSGGQSFPGPALRRLTSDYV